MSDRTAQAPTLEPPPPAAPTVPPPRNPPDALHVAVIGLFAIGTLFTIYFGRDVLLPIALAMLLNLLLRPIVRGLRRWRIPDAVGAAIVLLGVVGVGGSAVYSLSAPATEWVDRMPLVARQLELKLGDLRTSLAQAREATRRLEEMAGDAATTREVVVRGPSLVEQVLNQTQAVMANVVIMLVLLYFLLARGRQSLEALIGTMRSIDDRVHYAMLAATVQQNIAAYLATVTIINAGLGVATGFAMWLLGVPNPTLWGVVAAVLNFVPFIGSGVTAVLIFLVSVLTFESLRWILLPPLVFLALTTLEGNFITPTIVGRRLSLNPIAVFIAILFWGWMWGIPGALLAVPILAVVKILCDASPRLRPLGALLGQ